LGGRAAEYSWTGHAVYSGISLKIRDNLSMMSLSSSSPPGIRDVSLSPVYSKPKVSRAINGYTIRFMKLKATCSALCPASLSTLMRASSSGSWIPSCMVGSEFHHSRCLGCRPLGFGRPGVMVHDIEPSRLPISVGVHELVRQILLRDVFPQLDVGSSDYPWVGGTWLRLDAEELPE
jgi:hypothetical protein